MLDKINEAKKFINDLTSNKKIHTVIILGSGMSGFEKNYDIIHQVSYSDIPNFLQPSIEGHSGTLSIVEIEEKYTALKLFKSAENNIFHCHYHKVVFASMKYFYSLFSLG